MKKRRRVAVITGTRAEYGLLRSTMTALTGHANVHLQVVVAGLHLLKNFGHTIDEILADRWRVDASVPMQRGDDGLLDQAEGLARGVAGIARFLKRAKTDLVVVLGDRIEALAGALAAVTTGKCLAHIHGGDLAQGDADDAIRHSITKLAHLHLAATPAAAERIIRMGEPAWRVHVVGAPGLDRMRELQSEPRPSGSGVGPRALAPPPNGRGSDCEPRASARAEIRSQKAIIVHHPCGRSADREQRVMKNLLRAVQLERLPALCIHPNSDRGSAGIIAAIQAHGRIAKKPEFQSIPSLPRDDFLLALRRADLLIGNSSCGIIEAGALGTPAVNIGPRQNGREVNGNGVIHCGESISEIRGAVRKALLHGPITKPAIAYGDGRAGTRIARILARVTLDERFLRKLNAY